MKIHKNCKIELVAAEHTKPAICEPYLDIQDGKANLIATDGWRIVVIPVETTPKDVAGYVSEDVLKTARKVTGRAADCSIELNGCAKLENGATLPRNGSAGNDLKYPNWRQVIPKPYEKSAKVAINARFLWEIAQAMGCESVTLEIADAASPIIVKPTGKFAATYEAHAVLMPIRTE
jgi:DNA polymerase III sliding clamp (beta) subunit (PCNA family)